MASLIAWLIKSVIISGVLYTYYLVVLRLKKMHVFNRCYLLSTLVLSLVLPLFRFNVYQATPRPLSPLVFLSNVITTSPVKQSGYSLFFNVEGFIVSCSLLISLALLGVMVSKILWLRHLKKLGNRTMMDGFVFIETDARQAPFSFLNTLFWRKGMVLDSINGKKIFNHELAHIKQGHSYDKLFSQTVTSFFWMNPFYWLIQKELLMLHEFMADAAAIDAGDTNSFATMLLQAHNDGAYLQPAHSFFHPSIKFRLQMIETTSKPRHAGVRRFTALPIVIGLIAMLSFTTEAQQTATTTEKKQSVDHIEIHGQTGIADTAIVYFKEGKQEKYLLNKPDENKAFNNKYGTLLELIPAPLDAHAHPAPGLKQDHNNSIGYKPLNPIPSSISNITFGSSTVWLTLVNGQKEQYDLTNANEKKTFESKYGKLEPASNN